MPRTSMKQVRVRADKIMHESVQEPMHEPPRDSSMHGGTDLSAMPRRASKAPTLMALQQSAKRLIGCAETKGNALYAPMEGSLPMCVVFMRAQYDDCNTISDIELVLCYICTVAENAGWDMEGITLKHGPVLQNINLCNIGMEGGTIGRRNSDRVTTQGRKQVVSSILIASFLAARRFGENDFRPQKKENVIIQHTILVTTKMRAFLQRICSEDCIASTYNPEVDRDLQGLWRGLQEYLDLFLTWNVSAKGMQHYIMQRSLLCLKAMRKGLKERLGLEGLHEEEVRHIVPGDLEMRLDCSIVLSLAITRKDQRMVYPTGSSFHPRHPCDVFLRLLLGDASHDFVIMPIHESISSASLRYSVPCMDALTDFITSRRYAHTLAGDATERDNMASIHGSIIQSSNEALVHSMHCRGMGCSAGATRASGYDPARSFLSVVGGGGSTGIDSPWFPGVGGGRGLQDLREASFWATLRTGLAAGGYAAAEECIVILRTNFACMFNAFEARQATGMMVVDVPKGAIITAPNVFQHLARMCTEFMRGPVLTCAKRHGMAKDIVVPWSVAERRLQEMVQASTLVPTPTANMAETMASALQCMDNASRLMDKSLALTRHRIAGNMEPVHYLRTCLFRRAAEALPPIKGGTAPHPLRTFMETLPCIKTTFTAERCASILSDEDSTSIFPATQAWMQDLTAGHATALESGMNRHVASRVSWWVVHHIPFCTSSDAGTPEVLAPSLPLLDRLSVVCSVCTALVVSISLGYQDPLPPLASVTQASSVIVGLGSEDNGKQSVPYGSGGTAALALFSEGVERETYEWDSSFVKRLLLRDTSTQRHYLEDVIHLTEMIAMGQGASRTASSERIGGRVVNCKEIEVVQAARGFVERLLFSAMLGGGEGVSDAPPCIAVAVTASLVDTMLQRHLRGVGSWFAAHMAVYGVMYSAYVR